MDAAERHGVRVAAVGVGSAGPITRNCETVSPVEHPGVAGVPAARAPRRADRRTRVYGDLDGKALALAEGWQGAAKGSVELLRAHRVDRHRRRDRARRRAARRRVRQRRPRRPHHRRAQRPALRLRRPRAASRPRRRAWRSRRSPGARRPSRRTRSCSAPGRLVGRAVASLCNAARPRAGRGRRRRRPRVRGDVLQRRPGGAQHAAPACRTAATPASRRPASATAAR